MKQFFILLFLTFASLTSCTSQTEPQGYTDLEVNDFKAKIAEPGTVLLDVRTPEETTSLGMIEGAGQLDFEADNFEAEIEKLDKEKTYLVYCRSGNRSGQACALMAQKGFKNLYNLKGGYRAWTAD
ncbi:MAG: rhodanese-like domain-containing protein [Saprospiraceae bacterium]|nr:rhodanese-like domain-containing protein [Saprospiraceae bacterium]MCF8251898.1 rhodanese-like domain-containing protein [Saprospiraceae bacterium]MCF8281609.1 rhodanese-like domain-containing protein [Bacteroidales bacterium]MCF8313586.1 rhodanese-like domain-containing protein [Saprospiraceae bacterium]MCF8442282.1 rhodanese-like domain-containing protein [Saprospiraceae bacterium]